MAEVGKNIDLAADLLMADEVVAIPTETVYGLAGNALSERAIRKIFEVKNRPFSDPLIVHLPDVESVRHYVKQIPDLALQLFQAFSPGPLTILLPKSDVISDLVTNGSPLVAIRIPSHPLTIKLLRELPFPLVAPSANPFGHLSPTRPEHVQQSLGSKIPYILDGGPCSIGLESTIIQIENEVKIRILRQGGISEDALLAISALAMDENRENEVVPGSMESHYAPVLPLKIGPVQKLLVDFKPHEIGWLGFNSFDPNIPSVNQRLLSAKADLSEAARHLFDGLYQLEKLPVKVIGTEYLPDSGIGKAINERLKRASAKRG